VKDTTKIISVLFFGLQLYCR